MATDTAGDALTSLLDQWRQGSPEAEAALIDRVHRELRQLAASHMRRERGATLQPTALVHEAYLRLLPQRGVHWENRAHFFGIASRMMRRVLVDRARRRRALKRDGVTNSPVSIGQLPGKSSPNDVVEVLDLHDALNALAAIAPRQADMVEKRYFGGLTIEEVSEATGVAPATVKRDLKTAQLWLRRRLRAA